MSTNYYEDYDSYLGTAVIKNSFTGEQLFIPDRQIITLNWGDEIIYSQFKERLIITNEDSIAYGKTCEAPSYDTWEGAVLALFFENLNENQYKFDFIEKNGSTGMMQMLGLIMLSNLYSTCYLTWNKVFTGMHPHTHPLIIKLAKMLTERFYSGGSK